MGGNVWFVGRAIERAHDGEGERRHARHPRSLAATWAHGIALLLLLLLPLAAQKGTKGRPLDEALLQTLHRAGLGVEQILEAIDRNGLAELDDKAVARLREQGVSPIVLARIEKTIAPPSEESLTVTDVVNLHLAGIPEEVIVQKIEECPTAFEVSVDDTINLARQGLSPRILRALREHRPAGEGPKSADGPFGLADVVAMARIGFSAERMLEKIRRKDPRFRVGVEDLIKLDRDGVPQEVLSEIWKRRVAAEEKAEEGEPRPVAADGGSAPAPAPQTAGPELLIERDPAGGFSLTVPAGWHAFRQASGRNALLSLTSEPVEGAALAEAEIQVLRVKSQEDQRERLVAANLRPIADNFVRRLAANYAAKQMTLTHAEPVRTTLSGQPALLYSLTSSAADGTTHEGEFAVTFYEDQVFVVSWAVRADLEAQQGDLLATCLRSFTFERDTPPLEVAATADAQLEALFKAWREAVKGHDYSLYRRLLPKDQDTPARRREFVKLAGRLAPEGLSLLLGPIDASSSPATIECRVLGPDVTETVVMSFEKTAHGYRLE